MIHFYRFFLLICMTGIISSILNIELKENMISTLYNVSGIMFSIGLGLIVTFNISDVRNNEYIKQIRMNIINIRNIFIYYFIISTFIYVSYTYIKILELKYKWFILKFDPSIFACISLFFSIVYFTINFLSIQKLNDEIFDRILEEQE